MYIDNGGFLWVKGNDGRLLRFALTGSLPVAVESFETNSQNLMNVIPIDGNLVFFFEEDIREYDPYTCLLTESSYRLPSGVTISSALLDSRGNLYVGSSYEGLFRIDRRTGEMQKEPLSSAGGSTKQLVVDCIMEDKDRNLWMACPHTGLFLSNAGESPFRSVEVSSGGKPLSQGFVSIVPAEDEDGVYCVERLAGVFHINHRPKHDVWEHHSSKEQDAAAKLCNDWIGSFFCDRNGLMWIGTANGVSCFDSRTNSLNTPYAI